MTFWREAGVDIIVSMLIGALIPLPFLFVCWLHLHRRRKETWERFDLSVRKFDEEIKTS